MTDRQKRVVAAALKENYTQAKNDEQKKLMLSVMIDVANAINGTSTVFDRGDFLKMCGHPEYAKGFWTDIHTAK